MATATVHGRQTIPGTMGDYGRLVPKKDRGDRRQYKFSLYLNYAMSVEMIYLNHTLNMAIRTRIKKT